MKNSPRPDLEYEEINTDLESIKDKIEMPGGNRQDRGIELVKLSRNLMHTFESQSRIDAINAELRICQLNEPEPESQTPSPIETRCTN